MTRCLLSAVAVCVLYVSMTGSADAGSKTKQNFSLSNGTAIEQQIRWDNDGSVREIKAKGYQPDGVVIDYRYQQNDHHTSIQTKVKGLDGKTRKWKTRY